MVVTALAPALIVPDEQTWTVHGTDPARLGLEPTFALGRVEHVLAPAALPAALAEPMAACLAAVPEGVDIDERPLDLPGRTSAEAVHRGSGEPSDEQHAHAGHQMHGGPGDHGDHGEHGGHHDHHDMMAIVGEPSSDGLVMEPIELRYGPLGTPLPGGLAVDVTLDGDVVAEAAVRGLLSSTIDPLAPVAAHRPGGWQGVAAIEVERAVSHLAWLRAFGRLLGWPPLVDACTRAIASTNDIENAQADVDAVAAIVHGSRWLRIRTQGRGTVTGDEASAAGLHGPNARASGLARDARLNDPRYRALGFAPVVRDDGDAHARALVRAREAQAALQLATAAARAPDDPPQTGAAEGPRGREAHAARGVASAAMVGAEWATALVILASFDLSPWDVAA